MLAAMVNYGLVFFFTSFCVLHASVLYSSLCFFFFFDLLVLSWGCVFVW
jgi:hypothetical protein